MINRQGGAAGVALIILLIILLGVSLYFLYLNLPTDPVALKIVNFKKPCGKGWQEKDFWPHGKRVAIFNGGKSWDIVHK